MVGKVTPAFYLSTTEMIAVNKISKYKTPNDILAQKLVVREKNLESVPSEPENEKMKYGNRREAEVITDTAEVLNCVPKTDITTPYGWYGADKPLDFINASLDGLLKPQSGFNATCLEDGYIYPNENPTGSNPKIRLPQGQEKIKMDGVGICEAKTHMNYEIYNDLPRWLGRDQLQMQMKCYGAKWGTVSVLFNGNELVIYVFERDENIIKEYETAGKDFYRRLKNIDYYPVADMKDAVKVYGTAEEDLPPVDLGGNNREVALELYEAKKLDRVNKELIAGLEAEMVEKLGLHEVGVLYDEIGNEIFRVERKNRRYKASAEKIIPPRPARVERQKSLTFKSDWSY